MSSDKNVVDNKSLDANASNDASSFEKGLRKFTKGLDKIVYFLNNITHKVAMLVIFLMMFLTTGDVVGRYFFGNPITGTFELTGLGIAIIVFFSLGMTQITGDHIEIDFLTKKFPEKVQEVLNAVVYLALFILLILTAWYSGEYAYRIWEGNRETTDLGIPLFIFTIFAVIGIFFFALTLLVGMFKSLVKVVQKK